MRALPLAVLPSARALPRGDTSELRRATDALQAVGITREALAAAFPGARVRRLHFVATRLHVGVDPRGHTLADVAGWLVGKALPRGLEVRVHAAPLSECCGSGCGGCLTKQADATLRDAWLEPT